MHNEREKWYKRSKKNNDQMAKEIYRRLKKQTAWLGKEKEKARKELYRNFSG